MTKHLSPDERNRQILEAARTCFLDRGYFATKMDDIAKTAGLSKGGVYFHFQSKRDIFHALVSADYEEMYAFVDNVVIDDANVEQKLLVLGEHFIGLFGQHNRARMLIIVSEMSMRDEEIRQQIQDFYESYVQKIAELLSAAQQSGQLREDVDTEAVAFLLKAVVDGIQAAASMGHVFELERLAKTTVGVIMNGIKA